MEDVVLVMIEAVKSCDVTLLAKCHPRGFEWPDEWRSLSRTREAVLGSLAGSF
jgi:hypothetical protein